MGKKIIISEEQALRAIAPILPQNSSKSAPKKVQENYLYHRGQVDDEDFPSPYRSEARWQKFDGSGHETGSFGSGMYFTDAHPFDDRFHDMYDKISGRECEKPGSRRFVKIDDALYSVDTEFYKNLYVVKSQNEAAMLVNLLEAVNSFFRTFQWGWEKETKRRQFRWLQINNIAQKLGLRVPWTYREMCEFAQKYVSDESIRQTPSTIFMELNGFNGVDASRGGKYNSYWQGSVIYDLSKVEQHMTPVLGPRNEWQLAHGGIVYRNMYDDIVDQESNPTYYTKDDDTIKPKEDPQKLLQALKRYPYILPKFRYSGMPDDVRSKYLDILYRNIKSGYVIWEKDRTFFNGACSISELSEYNYLKDIIGFKKYYYINLEKSLTEAIFHKLAWGYGFEREDVIGFINAYNGNVEQDFPEDWEFIKDDYQL